MLPILIPFLFIDAAAAYSWNFASAPTQCGNLTVDVSGGGTGPYSVLIVPFGSSPFANNTEVRVIIDKEFSSASATSVTFPLAYPADSQFVAVVSDATGFGSGGTSVVAIVQSSDDSSCYDPSKNVSPDFFYSITPSNQIVQCQETRISWDTSQVQGNPVFHGVIPGGESFTIPQGSITNVTGEGTGFSWTPNIRGGTTLLIVGGDDRGLGTAGSSLYNVGSGTSNNNTCLSSDSPSSTPGNPAGGSYATSTSGAGTSGSPSSSGNHTGAIVGGVVGGIIALIAGLLLLLFFRRRSRVHKQQGEKPVDLLHEDDDDDAPQRTELPQYYQPEPFMVPDPTVASDSGRASSDGRPVSQVLSDGTSGSGRKGPMKSLRPVNIIQHDDAGPSEIQADEEPETVELPPAYTNIRK